MTPVRGLWSLDRLRHHCGNPACHRNKLWSRWLTQTETIEFRGAQYCCAACAERAFEERIGRSLLRYRRESHRPHRIPLGLLLISRGVLTSPELQKALDVQRQQPGRRLGSLLFERGVVSEQALVAALGIQWGCPVFPLENSRNYLDCVGLLPFALLQPTGVLPVHYSPTTGILHLAFTKRIDHTLIYAIEGMVGCRVTACVASERRVHEALNEIRSSELRQETVFDSVRQPSEMARMVANYAGKLHALRVAAAETASNIWFRFESSLGIHHLLFQIPQKTYPEDL